MDFKRRMDKESVKTDLELVNMSDPIALLDSFMMDEDTVDQYVGDGPLHTDNRPRMEFFGTRMGDTTSPNVLGMKRYRQSVIPLLDNMGEDQDSIEGELRRYSRSTEYSVSGQLFYIKGDFENAMRQYEMASFWFAFD